MGQGDALWGRGDPPLGMGTISLTFTGEDPLWGSGDPPLGMGIISLTCIGEDPLQGSGDPLWGRGDALWSRRDPLWGRPQQGGQAQVSTGCLCPGGQGEPTGPTSGNKFRGPHTPTLLCSRPGSRRASVCPPCPQLCAIPPSLSSAVQLQGHQKKVPHCFF